LPFDNRRPLGLGQIRARASSCNTKAVEFGDRVLHAIRSSVRDVIACQRRHVEPRALEGSEMRRIAGRCGNIEMRLYPTGRMRNFNVPHKDVTRLEVMARQIKQSVGIRLVENQIADHLESKRLTHGKSSDSGALYT